MRDEHPLRAIRRTGLVTGTANLPATLTVSLGGDLTTALELPYLASYVAPSVGDLVLILGINGDNTVIGAVTRWLNPDGSTGAANRPGGRLLNTNNSSSSVALTSVGVDVATAASAPFTLVVATQVLIQVQAVFIAGAGTAGGFMIQPAYSPGGTADTTNMMKLTRAGRAYNNSGLTSVNGAPSAAAFGYANLGPGTYTAFGAMQRTTGGAASDVGTNAIVGVEDCGS